MLASCLWNKVNDFKRSCRRRILQEGRGKVQLVFGYGNAESILKLKSTGPGDW